jgi:hypothetical protein
MKFLVSNICAACFATMLFACSGGSKIGESCTKTGATSECVEGAVCSKDTGGAVKCLKLCTAQTDCSGAESCNGVEGSSLKACRLK